MSMGTSAIINATIGITAMGGSLLAFSAWSVHQDVVKEGKARNFSLAEPVAIIATAAVAVGGFQLLRDSIAPASPAVRGALIGVAAFSVLGGLAGGIALNA